MDCETFRGICDADPGCRESAYVEHAESCAACADHQQRARRLNALIGRALRVRVPELDPVVPTYRWSSVSWLGAVAASIVLAIAIVAGTGLFPRNDVVVGTLAADVVEHIIAEPKAFTQRGSVTPAVLAATLASHDARLVADIGEVVYAETCLFRGHLIPHLVVRTEAGLVTVLVLADEHSPSPIEIVDNRMSGQVVPVRGRAIAIVGQSSVPSGLRDGIVAGIEWGV